MYLKDMADIKSMRINFNVRVHSRVEAPVIGQMVNELYIRDDSRSNKIKSRTEKFKLCAKWISLMVFSLARDMNLLS